VIVALAHHPTLPILATGGLEKVSLFFISPSLPIPLGRASEKDELIKFDVGVFLG